MHKVRITEAVPKKKTSLLVKLNMTEMPGQNLMLLGDNWSYLGKLYKACLRVGKRAVSG